MSGLLAHLLSLRHPAGPTYVLLALVIAAGLRRHAILARIRYGLIALARRRRVRS